MDSLIQKILFLTGGAAVAFGDAYGLYSLWEEHTISGRCFSAERTLERHSFGMEVQQALNLADDKANRKRTLELCFIENNACFEGYSADIRDFCNAQAARGG